MDNLLDLKRIERRKRSFAWKHLWKALFSKYNSVDQAAVSDIESDNLEKGSLSKAIKWSKRGDLGWQLKLFSRFVTWVRNL